MGTPATPAERLLLVDGSSVFMRAYSVLPEDKRTAQDLDYLVCGMLAKACRHVQATRLCVALDSVEPCWRYQYHPDYKGGRTYPDLSAKQLTTVVGPALRSRGVPMLYATGMEADDLLATAVHTLEDDAQVYVYTRDSDLYWLLAARDTWLLWPENGGKLRLIDAEQATQDLGHEPHLLPEVRALVAERKDNLRGLLGAQGKVVPVRVPLSRPRAVELLKLYRNSVPDVLESATTPDGGDGMRPLEREYLSAYADEIMAILQVARLSTEARLRLNPVQAGRLRDIDLTTRRSA